MSLKAKVVRIRTEPRNRKEIAELVEADEERRKATDARIEREISRELAHPQPIPLEPCCGNCVHWWPPIAPKKTVYGQCDQLVVINPGRSNGDTWHVSDVRLMGPLPREPLRTGARFPGCSRHERKAAA